jgi:hypothetical protein
MSLQYPINPDTSFESFVVTNEAAQIAALGRSYGINELLPVNYTKIMNALYDDEIPGNLAPIREFLFISVSLPRYEINDEISFTNQTETFVDILIKIRDYWQEIALKPPFRIPLGVITEIKEEVIHDTRGVDSFHIINKVKINWFALPGNDYV